MKIGTLFGLAVLVIIASIVVVVFVSVAWNTHDLLFEWRPIKLSDLGLLISALLTVVVAVWVYSRQANAHIYMEYNQRYEQVMQDFPEKVRLDFAGAEPGDVNKKLLLCYLNLCSEEFYLWQACYLSNRVWSMWKNDIELILQADLMKAAWKELSKEFDGSQPFQQFVNEVQEKREGLSRWRSRVKWWVKRFL